MPLAPLSIVFVSKVTNYGLCQPAPQTKLNLWLSPSARWRRNHYSGPRLCVPAFQSCGNSLSLLGAQNKDFCPASQTFPFSLRLRLWCRLGCTSKCRILPVSRLQNMSGLLLRIGLAWRKNSLRVSRTRSTRASHVRPQSCFLFSASLQTLGVTIRAYLNTQKYGLFCSLICITYDQIQLIVLPTLSCEFFQGGRLIVSPTGCRVYVAICTSCWQLERCIKVFDSSLRIHGCFSFVFSIIQQRSQVSIIRIRIRLLGHQAPVNQRVICSTILWPRLCHHHQKQRPQTHHL